MNFIQRHKQLGIAVVVLLLTFAQANAKVLLPQILANNMVLQRDVPLNIWGFAVPGEQVSVAFGSQLQKTVADKAGRWKVILAPLATSSVPQKMTITGSNQIVLDNILVGEVWLCSGQSNMEYQMRKLVKIPTPKNPALGFPKNAVEEANNKNIRIFLVNRKTLSKPDSLHKGWSVAQDSALRAFSAVGYFFAKELQEKLGIPVGIISSAVSGSAIEPWIAKSALEEEPFFKDKKVSNDPGKFYTPMIEPLSPFKLRGFLWYQGETNCFLNEKIDYAYKLKTLINLWRNAWGDQKMPFYYVQIAPYNYSKQKGKVVFTADTQPEFWEAQAQLLKMPNTGIVVTTDLNDNGEDLHPTYKWVIGKRLSLWPLAKVYDQKVEYAGPLYESVSFKKGTAFVNFDHANGMKALGSQSLKGFEIAGADGKFYPATTEIKGKQVLVKAQAVKQPKAVRFNWDETAPGNLYNEAGLPALPFRSNNPLNSQFNSQQSSK